MAERSGANSTLKVVGIVFGVIALLCTLGIASCCLLCGGLAAIGSSNSPKGSTLTPAPQAPVSAKPMSPEATHVDEPSATIRVSSRDLADAFRTNEVAAEDRYKGQRIAVFGKVERIRTDFTGDAIVELQTSNRFMPVSAELRSRQDSSRVSVNSRATLECDCGIAVMGRPNLPDCVLAE